MAVVDDFGRVTRLTEDLKSLADSLKASVGKAVEYATGKSKESADKMKEEFDRLVEAMEELGDDVKENLKTTRGFVEEVKKAADSVDKARASRSDKGVSSLEAAQREQTKILQQILRSHQKAVSDKAAKFTSGATALASPPRRKSGLKEMGFRPRGADKIPAMVSPGEFVVSKKGAQGNEGLLDRINRGYMRGGKVKPQYLADGTKFDGRSFDISVGRTGKARIVVEGDWSEESERKFREQFAQLGDDISVEFTGKFEKEFKKRVATWTASIATAFTGRGDPWQIMFEGAVKDVTEFRREMRNLAFQTEGITGNFREAQAEFAKIGKDITGRTGVNVTAFQKAYMNNVRKGFKDQKAGMKVLESGLKLSTLIGSESQATASLFADWHRELGLGAVQMERMANNMQMVARNTGVTGDELISVMKSSEQVLKNLRNQGTLTTTAARNVTQAMAEFKKQGFEEAGQSLLGAMSGYSAFNAADKGTKTFLQIAADRGGVDQLELMHGSVLQDQEKMGKMGTGLRDFLAQSAGFKPENYDKFDMDLLSEDQRRQLSIVLDSMGKSLGDADAAMKAVGKSAKGLGGELSDLDKASKSVTATQEQRKEAEKKMNDRLMAASMDQLGSVMQAAEKFSDKSLSDLSGELKKDTKFGRDFQSGAKDMAAMAPYLSDAIKSQFGLSGTAENMSRQVSTMDTERQVQMMSLASAEQIDKALAAQGKDSQDFSKRMQAALANKDMAAFKTIAGEMATARQGIQVADAAGVDPMEKLEQTMNELNETIRNSFSPLTGGLLDLIGHMGLLGIQVGMMGTTLYSFFGGNFLKYLAPGNLRASIDDLALSFATSEKAKDGILKKFATTYAESRTGPGKGVAKSLNDAFGSVRDDMLKGMSKMKGATVEFFQNAGKSSTRFFGSFMKGFRRGFKSSGNFFTAMTRGFSGAMKSTEATRGVLARMGGLLKNVNLKYAKGIESLMKTSPALAKFAHHSVNLGKAFTTLRFGEIFTHFGRTMKSGFSVFKNFFNPKSWTTLFSTGFKGMKGAILGGTLGTAQIVFSAIDMVFGAVSGFMNTGKRFEGVMKAMGKSTKDMTWGMYASSTITGALVGILDGLTFGLLRFSGAAEFLEQTLSYVLYAVFSVVEGIVEGFLYPFRLVWDAVKYIGAQFKSIGDSILGVFNAIAGIFGAEAGNWSEAFAMVYPWLKAIGRVIGYVVGMPLAGFLWLLVKGISAALVPIQMLINAITGVIRVIAGFVKFFTDIFRVGLWQATKNLAGTIFSAIYGIFKPVVDFIWSLVSDITAPFRWLYDVLVGHSIVPDLVKGIIGWFAQLPGKIFKFLVGIPIRILKRMPKALVGVFTSVFHDFPKWLFGKMSDGIWAVGNFLFLTLPKMMWDGFKKAMSSMGKYIWDTLTWPFRKIGELLKAVFYDFPVWLGTKIMEGLKAVFYDLPVWLGKTIWDGMASIAAGIPGALYGALHAAASAIGLGWLVEKLGGGKPSAGGPKGGPSQAGAAGGIGSFATGAIGLVAAVVGLRRLSPAVLKLASSAFGMIGSLVPKNIGKYAQSAFKFIKDKSLSLFQSKSIREVATKAFESFKKITPSGVLKTVRGAFDSVRKFLPFGAKKVVDPFANMGGAMGRKAAQTAAARAAAVANPFANMGGAMGKQAAKTAAGGLVAPGSSNYKILGDTFKKLKDKGVFPKRATKLIEDTFKSAKAKGLIPKNASKLMVDSFKSIKSFFSPMTRSFSRAMARGEGLFGSLARGAKSQITSVLKGSSVANFASKAFKRIGEIIPSNVSKYASTAFSKIKGLSGGIMKMAAGAFSRIRGAGLGGLLGKGGAFAKGLLGRATGALGKVGGLGGVFGKAGGFIAGMLGKSGGLLGKAGTLAAGTLGKVGGMATGALGKAGGMATGAMGKAGTLAAGTLGKVGGMATGALGKAGGIATGAMGKAGGLLGRVAGKGLGALAKGIPVLGALVDFGARKAAGESTGKAAVGAGGGLAGAAAGAAIGTMILPGIGTAIGGVIGGLGGGWLADKLYDNIGPVFKTVGEGISSAATFAWDGVKKVGSTLWEGAKGLGSKLWEGTKNLTSKLSDGAKWLRDNAGSAMLGPISWFSKGLKNVGSWLFGGGEKGNKDNVAANMAMAKIEAQTVILSTSVGQHAVPVAKPEGGTPAAGVEPVHLKDITGTILRERAGSGGNRLQSDELSRMEEASYKQVSELEQIRQGIQELVSLMKPKGGVAGSSDAMGPGSTKDPRRPMHAARFGKMKFGVAGGMANRSVVNNGEV